MSPRCPDYHLSENLGNKKHASFSEMAEIEVLVFGDFCGRLQLSSGDNFVSKHFVLDVFKG